MATPQPGQLLLIVKIKTNLPETEMLEMAHERAPEFRAIPGLIQKYYVRLHEPNTYGGVYIGDSPASLQAYRQSELAATIAKAYQATEPPQIEVMDILFPLRD